MERISTKAKLFSAAVGVMYGATTLLQPVISRAQEIVTGDARADVNVENILGGNPIRIMVICTEENEFVNLYFENLTRMEINGVKKDYDGVAGLVVGNRETRESYVSSTYVRNIDTRVIGHVGIVGEAGELVRLDDNSPLVYNPGSRLVSYPFIPSNRQIAVACYTLPSR